MKRLFILFCLQLVLSLAKAQNPGLAISEVFVNPAGTDSCKEYVELIATQNINFNSTPYSVIVNNNGIATTNGWISGGALSYAFQISSGSVVAGQVVYVGGSCMTPTANQLRVINVKNVNGDGGIGSANVNGVFGNGGANADGVAVFNLPVNLITSSTVPTDALFWGTGVGTAFVSAIDGYQLPTSDLYPGGKLLGTSFITADPGADIITAIGVYNTTSNSWSTPRTFSVTNAAGLTTSSSVSLTSSASPATISFFSNDTTVSEASPNATVYARLTATSSAACSMNLALSLWSNASASDYTLATTTVSFAANAPLNSTFPIVFNINNDLLIESDEFVLLKFNNPANAVVGTNSLCAVYIKDNDKIIPSATNALTLNLLSSFSNSVSGANSAEIVTHDPSTQRLYIANSIGGKLDIINFMNPSAPTIIASIPTSTYGGLNSVAVRNGTVACAFENGINPQDSGKIVFFNANGGFLKELKVGAMPDMITFNNAGTKVLTANEGEPNAAYTNDPDGSVSIVDISGGISGLTQSNVTAITFTSYNGTEAALKAQGIRIFGVSGIASKDFEPEYVSVSKDDTKAWVTLQENNAIVEINLLTNTITAIRAMGAKDYTVVANAIDASNLTKGINLSNFPVKGFYQPDAIASYTVGGVNYYITANEGDARAYTGLNEESRFSALNLDPTKFLSQADLKNNSVLGRLQCTNRNGDTDNDGDIDTVYSYGSRSFSIWNGATGALVYDSKHDLELITSTNSFSVMFNASNTSATPKDRSDDKGPEPEGVAIGTINGNIYAFIALERIGGVMVYDVTNPVAPVFVTYVNNRILLSNGPDRGAEGIIFIPQSQSPNGQHIVIAANEVSSTLSIWGIPGCSAPIAASVSVNGNSITCSNQPPTISVAAVPGATYQWFNGTNSIPSATSTIFAPATTGNFFVTVTTGTNCFVNSLAQNLTVNPSPTVTIVPNTPTFCTGSTATLNVSGASTYTWNTNSNANAITVSPTVSTSYSVSASAVNGCTGTALFNLVVNPNPSISIAGNNTVCAGSPANLSASGATSYNWSNGSSTSSIAVSPTANTNYSVTGTSSLGCTGTATQQVIVNPLPIVTASATTNTICVNGTTVALNGSPSGGTFTGINVSNNVFGSATTVSVYVQTYSYTNPSTNCANTATTSINVLSCTGLKDDLSLLESSVNIYPNPSTSEFKIKLENYSDTKIVIYNSLGQEMLAITPEKNITEVVCDNLAKGIYFVKVINTSSNLKVCKHLIID